MSPDLHMPIINVDVDGVLYDFTGAMRHEVCAVMGIPFNMLPAPSEWRLHKAWPLTWAQIHSVMHDGIARGRLFRRGELIGFGSATQALQNIIELGWHVRLVTAKTFDDPFITMQARKLHALNLLVHLFAFHVDDDCAVLKRWGQRTDARKSFRTPQRRLWRADPGPRTPPRSRARPTKPTACRRCIMPLDPQRRPP